MRIGIVGGALQGMEAVYLSTKAGFETAVLDRKEDAPARSLADASYTVNVVAEQDRARKILDDCDVVIPACEELDALKSLNRIMSDLEKPFLFDLDSYELSSSKERSNEVFERIGVPIPRPWPECGFPVIVKPSSQSGSIGVSVANNEEEISQGLEKIRRLNDSPVIQEFVSGKSVSIEVIGNGETFRSYVTTEVVLDSNYDCKMVICEPGILCREDDEEFSAIGTNIADAIGLKGLMDVEAIFTDRGLRVLEIDSRIPSQTPAAIYAGTGVNLLDEFVRSATGKDSAAKKEGRYATYEHYLIKNKDLITCGEKQFGHVTDPYITEGLFGDCELITDYRPGKTEWRATAITKGKDRREVLHKRKDFISNLMKECGLDNYIDRTPDMI